MEQLTAIFTLALWGAAFVWVGNFAGASPRFARRCRVIGWACVVPLVFYVVVKATLG